MLEKAEFGARIADLRMKSLVGVSAREMSLGIGQSISYINAIENGKSYPSMETFFYICEYLDITPAEFFDTELKDPKRTNRLLEAARGLDSEQLDLLTALAKGLKRK